MHDLDYRGCWESAFGWDTYFRDEAREHRALWNGVYARAKVPGWAVQEAKELEGEWRLLAISEDWCGDAVNTLPVLARLAEAAPGVELRVVKRDEHPGLMDRHLTNGARSIPLVVVLDRDYRPVGTWGPRPGPLQEFILAEKRAGLRSSKEIYRDARTWYARDRGETTLREMLDVLLAASGRADRGGIGMRKSA